MRTRVVLRRPNATATPVTITTDATATAGDLADALVRADPSSAVDGAPELRIHRPDDVDFRRIRRATSLTEAGFRAGSTIVVSARDASEGTSGSVAVARLVVVAGPDSGREIELGAGIATIGRGADCDLQLTDSQVSRLHARLLVGDQIEIIDAGSANGVLIGDGPVTRGVVRPDDIIVLGTTQLQVLVIDPDASQHKVGATGAVLAFNRSPRLVERYPERNVPAPEVPTPPQPTKFPMLALVAPVIMGTVMFSVTRNPMSLMFVVLSPMMMLGNWWSGRSTGRKKLAAETLAFTEGLDLLRQQIATDHAIEREARLAESPATRETVGAALGMAPVLWSARPRETGFGSIRLGTGTAPSRTTIDAPPRGQADATMWAELQAAMAEMADVPDVPHVAELTALGVLGIAGELAAAEPVARAIMAQIACLHSPAELVIAGVASHTSAARWEWLSWLPHVDSSHSPLSAHLATSPAACATVVTQLEELIAARLGVGGARNDPALPWVVLLVEDDAPAERGRLVRIAEEGLAAGVLVIWRADTQRRLPASCRAVLVTEGTGARTGRTEDGIWYDIVPETLDAEAAMTLARHLAGVTDAGALTVDESDLPRAVGYLAVAGAEIASDPRAVIEQWNETGSILNRTGDPVRRSSDAHLRGIIGQGTDGEFVLDLRSQGPHALVGGTTGAGKSEFLQAWVMGMAAAHSPDRVTFLFVDYKGGAAFADCVKLPHTVGLVTDLAGHLVRRALTSLRAELRYREHLLAQAQAKDLLALERTGDPRTPPALIIVVDEFAALVHEIPEFVDGVVDVAQRGRSLGLHLVLATQRPAGVIKDNLRANTNLRIALRMADESDSSDVLGTPMAAHFDPRIPGRGAVRTGPGRLAMFQTGYVGGRSDSAPPPVSIGIESLTFGPGEEWTIPPTPESLLPRPADGPTDAARIVETLRRAATEAGIPAPRRPWLDEMPAVIALDTESGHNDGDLPLGMIDVPADQAQVTFRYRPDEEGSFAVYGNSGAGKSTVLRSLAVAAATAQGHVQIYGLDFAGGALDMLDALPQVGSIVSGNDLERVLRVTHDLVDNLDARAETFSAARASSVTDYRRLTGKDEPRIFLLVDGLGALREALDADPQRMSASAALSRLVAEGRPLGIHVILSAERPNAMSSAMAASISSRMIMRQSEENTYGTLGVAKDALGTDPLPGRAVMAGTSDEIQVAVPDGIVDTAHQSQVIERIGERLRTDATTPAAPEVRRLEIMIPASAMPSSVGDDPVLGVPETTLRPLGFERRGALLIAGMPGSGRTTTVISMAYSLKRHMPDAPLYYIGGRRSPAFQNDVWTQAVRRAEHIKTLLDELQPHLDTPAEDGQPLTLMIEAIGDLAGGEHELALAAAVRAAKRNGHLIIAESETPTWTTMSSTLSEIRASRRGIVLQPAQEDGASVLRVGFPRLRTADFPPGRGMYVASGTITTVQIPYPFTSID